MQKPEAWLPAFVRSWRLFLPELGRSVRSTFFYGWFDTVLRQACHDIFGCIAVQHTQYNFIRQGVRAATIAMLLLATDSAFAGRIAQPAKPDPILDGGDTHPCLAGADLASGMDVTGQPVAPADAGALPVPLPDQVLVPVGGDTSRRGRARNRTAPDGPYVALDGRKLAPLLDPGLCPR
jgi:hypothetical protein